MIEHGNHVRLESPTALCFQLVRHTIISLSDTSGNACERIAVPTKRYCGTNDILKACALQKSRDGLRDGLLTALHVTIGWTDLIAGSGQVIAKLVDNIEAILILVSNRLIAPVMRALNGRELDLGVLAVNCLSLWHF